MSNEHITLHTQALAANPDLAFFWEATKKESMLLPHCADCGKTHWHPRLFCPFCFSNKLEWKESAGKATLYAATTLGIECHASCCTIRRLTCSLFTHDKRSCCYLARDGTQD
jgi:hypothetical protein